MIDAGDAILLFVITVAVGLYASLVGIGGGFLNVPVLLVVFHLSPEQAASTSLVAVFANAASGTIAYARQGRIDYKTGLEFAVATVPGAIAGAYIGTLLTLRLFSVIFGLLLIGVAIFALIRPRDSRPPSEERTGSASRWLTSRIVVDSEGRRYEYRVNNVVGIAMSFGAGFIASTLGIGGGIVYVPTMIYLLSVPVHIATATSLFIICIFSFVGSISHAVVGSVLYWHALAMAVGVIIGSQIGARVSRRLRGTWIVRLFSLALIVVGVRLIIV